MFDSLLLSLFFTLALILELFIYNKINLNFLNQGKSLHLSKRLLVFILLAVSFIFILITWYVMTISSASVLQIFYIFIFTVSLWFTLFLLFDVKYIIMRLFSSLGISLIFLILIQYFLDDWWQNIFMVSSILWVGPVIFKKYNISLSLFLIFILFFTAIDIYNIYVVKAYTTFSDESFFLNGLIESGEYLLGIGDFFFAFLSVSFLQRNFKISAAVWAAIFLPLPRFLLRIIFPEFAGVVFPYTIFMTPIILCLIFIYQINKQFKYGN